MSLKTQNYVQTILKEIYVGRLSLIVGTLSKWPAKGWAITNGYSMLYWAVAGEPYFIGL